MILWVSILVLMEMVFLPKKSIKFVKGFILVSILVLMEMVFLQLTFEKEPSISVGFNPCFDGNGLLAFSSFFQNRDKLLFQSLF